MYTSALLLQLKAHSIFRDGFQGYPAAVIFPLSCVFLLPATLCPDLLLKALLYFWPLLVSTGICLTAFYLFLEAQNRARGDQRVLIKVGKVEHVVEIRVSGEAKFGVCSNHVKVNCFLVEKSTLPARGGGRAPSSAEEPDDQHEQEAHHDVPTASSELGQRGEVEDDDMDGASQIRADSMAVCLWNCYFGSYSKWHYEDAADQDAQVLDFDLN